MWDKEQIAEGVALISATLPKGAVGPYQLQAAIAGRTRRSGPSRGHGLDYHQILALYDLLGRMSENPVVVELRDRRGNGARPRQRCLECSML